MSNNLSGDICATYSTKKSVYLINK